jgi:hypothetical protein
MIITFSTIGLLLLILIIGKINLFNKFGREVEELFAQSKSISNQTFHKDQLDNLPESVQRYFNHILKDKQPYINYARLKHSGQFKTSQNKEWVNIKGEQYFTVLKPGFIWKGASTMFTARDIFIADKGRLIVSLFSLYNIVDGKGEKFNQGELLRWLGESVWFPTNLLPSEKLHWTPIDLYSAKMTFTNNGLSVFYIVSFNEVGEIIQFETKRFMDEDNLETWIVKVSDYKEINGIKVPTRIEAIWRLKKGDYSYAKFNVTDLEYNKPEKF